MDNFKVILKVAGIKRHEIAALLCVSIGCIDVWCKHGVSDAGKYLLIEKGFNTSWLKGEFSHIEVIKWWENV